MFSHIAPCMFSCPNCTLLYMMHTHTLLTCWVTNANDFIMLWCLASSHVNFLLNYSLNSSFLGVLIRSLCFGANLLLIKFVIGYYALFCGICYSVLQMAPWKTTTQCGDKGKHMDENWFCSTWHFERYNHHFEKAPIIQERFVNLVDLKESFIPSFFEGKG